MFVEQMVKFMDEQRTYLVVNMKSFYASCECVMLGLDPMTTDLVVADPSRSKGTICLAVSPSLKKKGVKNRCRLHEIPSLHKFITAVPRMQLYINYSAEIYGIFLRHFAKEDIFVYSIDESFIDITGYLSTYQKTPRQMGEWLLREIKEQLGLPATCGIGTNMYLAKVALDITAKHAPDGIGMLTEESFRQQLWHHQPLTDFWRIGRGISNRLQRMGLRDMGAVAQAPFKELRKAFGVNAAILYDHAWGREPTTIADIKSYVPKEHSVSNGQVLPRDYSFDEAIIAVKEMADMLALEMVRRKVVTESVGLYVCYSMRPNFILPPANGTVHLSSMTSSSKWITKGLLELYHKIVNPLYMLRRIFLTANHVIPEDQQQLSLFEDPLSNEREHSLQRSILDLQQRFGKNAVFHGIDLLDAGTTRERNEQVGGHRRGPETDVQPRKNIPAL